MRFFVDHEPQPQPRQRFSMKTGRAYTPKTHPVNAFKESVKDAFRWSRGEMLTGPVSMSMLFLMPRPQRIIWKTKPMPRMWYEGKKDRDNLEKAVMDALNGLAYLDDKQVVTGPVHVAYAAGSESPGVVIIMKPAGNAEGTIGLEFDRAAT